MPAVGLWAERPALAVLATTGADTEELLLDDVGGRPDAALEDFAELEVRRLHRGVAIPMREVPGDRLEALPGRALIRQQIARAPWGAEGGHGCECSEGRPR